MYTGKDKSVVNTTIGIDKCIFVTMHNSGDNNIHIGHTKCRGEHRKTWSGRNGTAIHGDANEQ